ncbi:MAG: methyltetrahydrofolate cobalamin methyltransferase, partial [Notoacmeibacter sp.]|nr:methyltetrahydrofolate cobalamin methyltransferase [Notoacmeibacter sp.]
LVMPVGAINVAGRTAFKIIRRLREELKVNTTCGASNISFGLPNRHALNGAFLCMASGAGMTSAIMNPCRPQEMEMVRAANVLKGNDPDCMNWIRTYKDYKPGAEHAAPAPVAAPAASGGGRRGGRAARLAQG